MKFKEGKEKHPLFGDVVDLWVLGKEFSNALMYSKQSEDCEFRCYGAKLKDFRQKIEKLIISLDLEHKLPSVDVNINPNATVKDLVSFEEHYYNKVKNIGNKALESNDSEVFSYMSYIICEFKHYFCTLNESNDSGETSS